MASYMNVVGSSGWLEYFDDGPNAGFFAPAIENSGALVVPVISLYEVFKRVLNQRGEADALTAIAAMMRGQVQPLDTELALNGAKLSVELRLPMADALILAGARAAGAILWTQDRDLEGLPGVRFREKR